MIRVITSSTNTEKRNFTVKPTKPTLPIPDCVFTPSTIVELLQGIEELNGLEIFHETLNDGSVRFTIGKNVYGDFGA